MARRRLIAPAALACALAAAAQANPVARGQTVSPPDCPSVRDIVVELDPAPTDRTYLRVQHIGDPGTADLAGEAANPVTWDVGAVTGFGATRDAQRGFRDEPLPAGTSAFQLACDGAGFLINTFQFPHRAALSGEGPSASIARDFATPLAAFRDGGGFAIEATVRVPWVYNQRSPVADAGTAQVSFFYYARDTRSSTVIAHVLGIFDNRVAPLAGAEGWASDGHVAFLSSPIAPSDGAGNPVRFVSYSDASAPMQYATTWREPRRFVAWITSDNFRAAMRALRDGPLPGASGDPADYEILSFGVLGEVFPGTGDDDNVSLGASVTGLTLRELALPRIGRR